MGEIEESPGGQPDAVATQRIPVIVPVPDTPITLTPRMAYCWERSYTVPLYRYLGQKRYDPPTPLSKAKALVCPLRRETKAVGINSVLKRLLFNNLFLFPLRKSLI